MFRSNRNHGRREIARARGRKDGQESGSIQRTTRGQWYRENHAQAAKRSSSPTLSHLEKVNQEQQQNQISLHRP